jgi:hypothetical protein
VFLFARLPRFIGSKEVMSKREARKAALYYFSSHFRLIILDSREPLFETRSLMIWTHRRVQLHLLHEHTVPEYVADLKSDYLIYLPDNSELQNGLQLLPRPRDLYWNVIDDIYRRRKCCVVTSIKDGGCCVVRGIVG